MPEYTIKYVLGDHGTPGTIKITAENDAQAIEQLQEFARVNHKLWAGVDLSDGISTHSCYRGYTNKTHGH